MCEIVECCITWVKVLGLNKEKCSGDWEPSSQFKIAKSYLYLTVTNLQPRQGWKYPMISSTAN